MTTQPAIPSTYSPHSYDIGVVIVNWNTCDLLRGCLRSLQEGDPSVARRVIVIDNASTDKSADMVATEFPDVELFRNPTNDGFSKANNIGLRMLGYRDVGEATNQVTDGGVIPPRYALLLNPDTVVPANGLRRVIDRADSDALIGVLGPRLELPDGTLDLAAKRSFPTPQVMIWRVTGLSTLFPRSRVFGRYNLTYLDEHQEHEVDTVVGAFMLVSRAAIERVGLLDEQFWMYAEDIDWAYRIKQVGFKVVYYPAVTVLHIKRAASNQNPRTKVEFQRASLLFYRKHYAARTSFPMHLAVLIGLILKGGRPLWDEIRNTRSTQDLRRA